MGDTLVKARPLTDPEQGLLIHMSALITCQPSPPAESIFLQRIANALAIIDADIQPRDDRAAARKLTEPEFVACARDLISASRDRGSHRYVHDRVRRGLFDYFCSRSDLRDRAGR